MAVAVDAVGPTSAGTSSAASSTLSWTHTVGGGVANGAIVVFVNVDGNFSVVPTVAVTCATIGMTLLGTLEATSAGTALGNLYCFGITGVSTGANAIAVTISGGTPATATFIVGGSISLSGVASGAGGFGTPVQQNTDSTYSIAVPSVASSSVVVAGIAGGDSITAIATGSAGWLKNAAGNGANATGNAASGYNTGTGSVTVSWTAAAVSTAMIAVEVKQATSTPKSGAESSSGAEKVPALVGVSDIPRWVG